MKIQLKNFDRFEEYKTEIIIIISIFMGLGLILSYNNYEKYLASFLLFSFSSYLLIIVGIFQNVSFGILVFSLLLWMGFWLKNIVHLIFNYDYLEPIGNFDFSLQSINDLNLIISISFFSISSAVLILSQLHNNQDYRIVNYNLEKKTKFYLLLFVFLGMIISLYINNQFEVLKLGSSVSASSLPWMIRIIPTVITIIVPIILYLIFLSEINSKNNKYILILICICAISISLSIHSRAVLFLWLSPLIYYLLYFTDIFKKNKILIIILPILLFITISAVNYLRYSNTSSKLNFSEISQNFSKLLVDRWMGIEGLMAVYSYENKSLVEFKKLALEFREKQKLDYFTKNIAFGKKEKIFIDIAEKSSFASLPGPIAFLFLANNINFLICGLFLIIFLIYLLEIVVFKIINNILLTYFFIFLTAFNLSSLGVDTLRGVRMIIFQFVIVILVVKIVDIIDLKNKGKLE